MIDVAELEIRANKAAKRTRNNIPQGWWSAMFKMNELKALLATNRWELVQVVGTMKLPKVKPVTTTQVFMRKVK